MASRPPEAGPGPGDGDSPLVLLVDDNDRNLKLARDVLRAAGLRTVEAATGGEAISTAVSELPDVILLDLGLPDLHGVDVARALHADSRTAPIPVVALTASETDDDGAWLLAAGFAGYIRKPISIVEFPQQVRGYCVARTS